MPPSEENPGLSPALLAELQQRAAHAASNSYSPYSKFRVGAALLLALDHAQSGATLTGAIVTGTNVENASYRLTTCAEQAAIATAVSQHGPRIRLRAVAIANLNAAASTPCGACRQTLAEFASPDTPVLYPGPAGETITTTLGALLPEAFSLSL